MPGFDGTGPRGAGALSGRGRGNCAVPVGGMTGGFGRGMGRLGRRRSGMGRGFGGQGGFGSFGNWRDEIPGARPRPLADDRAMLQVQVEQLRDQLAQVESRLSSLDAPSGSQT